MAACEFCKKKLERGIAYLTRFGWYYCSKKCHDDDLTQKAEEIQLCVQLFDNKINGTKPSLKPESILYQITVPPHSACEIRWASAENSETLDSHILCGGPFRIIVIAD